VELNFAGLPAGADDRYFFDLAHNRRANWQPLGLDQRARPGLTDDGWNRHFP